MGEETRQSALTGEVHSLRVEPPVVLVPIAVA